MSNKLSELRAKIHAQQEKATFSGKKTQDGANYPFWDLADGGSSTIRFLPNGAESGDGFFWVEKLMIKLPFAGIRGKNTNQTIVNVPCMQMYGEKCPIQEEIKPLWKTDEDTARVYYKKKSFILHGFVRNNGVKDDVTPENPIRRFNVNAKLMKMIQAGLMDPEMEDMPTDFVNGVDFYINKTTQGKWADYTTSKWSRKSSSLTDAEVAALEAFPLADLSTYLPKKPDEQAQAVIMEMFCDSMAGEAYDAEKYGKFYKPYGLDDNDGEAKSATAGSGTHTTVSKKSVVVEEADDSSDEVDETPVAQPVVRTATATTSAGGQKQSVQDLLQQLKNNKK